MSEADSFLRARRKRYLEPGTPYVLPPSTKHWRLQQVQRASSQGTIAPTKQKPVVLASSFGKINDTNCSAAASDLSVENRAPIGDVPSTATRFAESDGRLLQPASTSGCACTVSVNSDLEEITEDVCSLFQGNRKHTSGIDPAVGVSNPASAPNDVYDDEDEVCASADTSACSSTPVQATISHRPDELVSEIFLRYGNATLPGSETTKAEALALIISFIVATGLPWEDVDHLLRLVNALFGQAQDVLPGSKYLLRKFWGAKSKDISKLYYYCQKCSEILDSDLVCPKCHTKYSVGALRQTDSFFVMLSFKDQVQHVVTKTKNELYANLQRLRDERREGGGRVKDITSGSLCSGLHEEGVMTWTDLSFTFNTDGSPVYKSSKSSIWPIQFILNELPPEIRFANCTVAGLWFGRKHPDMSMFLSKFVNEVQDMGPLTWQHDSGTTTSQIFPLCCSVDSPARATVHNQVQFNGYFGCHWCLARGEYSAGCVRYPYDALDEERTKDNVASNAALAMESGAPVNGIKGPSALARLSHFHPVWGYSLDYMHCILQGVTRQIAEHLFDSSNSERAYYLGSPALLAKINRRLLEIKPPHIFTRLPRSLGERSLWKASEWRHWLLFYLLPCTVDLLPRRHFKHLCRLVEGVFVLLSTDLTPADISRADGMMHKFVRQMGQLYGEEAMTSNVHHLLHVAKVVSQLGPLWAHSTFVFEGGNGKLLRSITAAKGVPFQVIERTVLAQELSMLLDTQPLNLKINDLCRKIVGYAPISNFARAGAATLLGIPKVVDVGEREAQALQLVLGNVPDKVVEYGRFSLQGTIFNSASYNRAQKSDSSIVLTKAGDFRKIEKIFHFPEVASCHMVCRKIITITGNSEMPPHIMECFLSPSQNLYVLRPDEIREVCVLLNFSVDDRSYVCRLPNSIERD